MPRWAAGEIEDVFGMRIARHSASFKRRPASVFRVVGILARARQGLRLCSALKRRAMPRAARAPRSLHEAPARCPSTLTMPWEAGRAYGQPDGNLLSFAPMSERTHKEQLSLDVSVVVPGLNEAASLPELADRIHASLHGKVRYEIIFVDDGSTDRSWKVIRRLHQANAAVRGVRLRSNFGKAMALSAGFARARGRIVVMMDADLQDDPADLPTFLEGSATAWMSSWAGRSIVWIRSIAGCFPRSSTAR